MSEEKKDSNLPAAMALSASDLPTIYSLLTNSMSGDVSLRKPAETALSQSESRPGFCSCLMVSLPILLFRVSVMSLVLVMYNACQVTIFINCFRLWRECAGGDYCEGFSFSG